MVGFTVTKGSTVEVSSDEPGFYGAWYVATIVDILEASPTKKRSSSKKKKSINKVGYLIKYDTLFEDENLGEHLTEVVHPSSVRPLPPVMVEDGGGGGDLEVNDVIEAHHRDGWWAGVIKKVIVDGENKKFIVAFENPHEEFEFNKSQLRLHVDWVDGGWEVPPKKTAMPELGDKNKSESNTDAHAGFTTPLKGTLPTDLENQIVGPKVYTRKRNRSQKKIGRNGEMIGKVNDSGTESDSKNRNMDSVEEASRGKRSQSSTGRKGNKKVKVPMLETLDGGTTSDYQQEWPFMKHSSFWAAIESLESFQNPPQKPHFSPLSEIKQDFREGLAIAHMVTFANMFQRISNLQLSDPNEIINNSLETLADLETHGFDVNLLRARLNCWKLDVDQHQVKLKEKIVN